jgi:hypothetical protein
MTDIDKVFKVCKIGQGKECCRYLAAGINGFLCLKLTEGKKNLDKRVSEGNINAQGDNCEGESEEEG